MRFIKLLLAATAAICVISCKRPKPTRAAPEGGQAAATQPAAQRPAAQPPAPIQDARLTEEQLLRFIALSRELAPLVRAKGVPIDASPAGFAAMAAQLNDDVPATALFEKEHETLEHYTAVGTRAWLAWSVAQVQYNAEAPLRENARQADDARKKLADAQAMVRTGVVVLSPPQIAQRAAAARDAATDCRDRARMWSQKASALREEISRALAFAGNADPNALDPRPPVQQQVLQSAYAANGAMVQELAAAERNERQELQNAQRYEKTADDRTQPSDPGNRDELIGQARAQIETCSAALKRLAAESRLLEERLREDQRVEAEARVPAVPPGDILLLRNHLAVFNDAWGMTAEGTRK